MNDKQILRHKFWCDIYLKAYDKQQAQHAIHECMNTDSPGIKADKALAEFDQKFKEHAITYKTKK